MVDTLITLLKQVFSAKLAERIHLHKSPETLADYIPKEILSSDYGGQEKSLLEMNSKYFFTPLKTIFIAIGNLTTHAT